MHLARRTFDKGVSDVDLYVQFDNLVLLEQDSGPTPEDLFGSSGIEYFVIVAPDQHPRLLQLLAVETALPLDDAGVERVGAAMMARFGGEGLGMVKAYREWMTAQDLDFTTAVH